MENTQNGPYFVVKEWRGPSDQKGIDHRYSEFSEAVKKADELGKVSFNAYDSEGNWNPVDKRNGKWQHSPTLATYLDLRKDHDNVARTSNVSPTEKSFEKNLESAINSIEKELWNNNLPDEARKLIMWRVHENAQKSINNVNGKAEERDTSVLSPSTTTETDKSSAQSR
jgi:hypothetical protein